jgi:hypothetical protein
MSGIVSDSVSRKAQPGAGRLRRGESSAPGAMLSGIPCGPRRPANSHPESMKRRWNRDSSAFHAFGVGTARACDPHGIPESMTPGGGFSHRRCNAGQPRASELASAALGQCIITAIARRRCAANGPHAARFQRACKLAAPTQGGARKLACPGLFCIAPSVRETAPLAVLDPPFEHRCAARSPGSRETSNTWPRKAVAMALRNLFHSRKNPIGAAYSACRGAGTRSSPVRIAATDCGVTGWPSTWARTPAPITSSGTCVSYSFGVPCVVR